MDGQLLYRAWFFFVNVGILDRHTISSRRCDPAWGLHSNPTPKIFNKTINSRGYNCGVLYFKSAVTKFTPLLKSLSQFYLKTFLSLHEIPFGSYLQLDPRGKKSTTPLVKGLPFYSATFVKRLWAMFIKYILQFCHKGQVPRGRMS